MYRVTTAIQPIMTKVDGDVSKEEKIVATGIGKQRSELYWQLQEQYIDMALFSETFQTAQNILYSKLHVYWTDHFLGVKDKTTAAVWKGIPHAHVDILSLVSEEATGVCIPNGNSEVLLAAVYKTPGYTWSDVNITENLVLHKNICQHVTASTILDSDHLPIVFHILNHVTVINHLTQAEKVKDWETFKSLAWELISPRTQINSRVVVDKAVWDFTASNTLAHRLSTSKISLLDLHNQHKYRLRKLWHETRDPACKNCPFNYILTGGNCEVTPQAIWPIMKFQWYVYMQQITKRVSVSQRSNTVSLQWSHYVVPECKDKSISLIGTNQSRLILHWRDETSLLLIM